MTTANVSRSDLARFTRAAPFWLSLGLIPLAWFCAVQGGWTLALLPLVTWFLFSALDAVLGLDTSNADLEATEDDMYWYRLVTLIWVPLQFISLFGLIWYATRAGHLGSGERVALFFGVGVITGTIGINYSHELMHQKNRVERFLITKGSTAFIRVFCGGR